MAGTGQQKRARRLSRPSTVMVAFAVLTLAGVGLVSPYAFISLVLDGLGAGIVLLPPALAGLWLVPLLRLGSLPLRWHLLLGAALGIGVMSLLMLLAGLAGLLQRPIWIAFLSALAVVGTIRLWTLLKSDPGREGQSGTGPDESQSSRTRIAGTWRYVWLLACPFLVLAVLAAANAPGFIWQEEGYGYDVLEYHLQLPKEYVQAGRIEYCPHNVYANFPANVEMLYLLAMIVHDDVPDVGTVANMIHLMLAALTVFAAWVAGREWSVRAGIVCGVMTATTGWLAYLSGLAYVENGMLFFSMTAVAVLIHILNYRAPSGAGVPSRDHGGADGPLPLPRLPFRALALTGVLAGLACGCKYTAVPMIALPVGLVILLLPARSAGRRVGHALAFALGMLVTMAPWLVKNQILTGNPVFPLANAVFEASPPGFGAEETERWVRGHSAPPDERSISARLTTLWVHVPGDKDQRLGPVLFWLAFVGLLSRRRDRTDLTLLLILMVQLITWLFATHLFARFAVVLLIPLVLLCGRAVTGRRERAKDWPVVVALMAACLCNFAFAAQRQAQESPDGAPASLIYDGRLAGYEYLGVVNRDLPADAKILLVGDARAFYVQRRVDYCVAFNRSPFLNTVLTAESDEDVLEWLREQRYTHVLVHWGELRRLASTYGLSPPVDPERLSALFDRLEGIGLQRLRGFPHPRTNTRYVDLYAVH